MRNLSTASNVYLHPSRDLTPAVSVREIHAHIHRCRYELSLFKHSAWPTFLFHVLQLSGQAPVVLPLAWFLRSRERRNPLVGVMRRGVMKPLVDACSESCTFRSFVSSDLPGTNEPAMLIFSFCAGLVTAVLTKYMLPAAP